VASITFKSFSKKGKNHSKGCAKYDWSVIPLILAVLGKFFKSKEAFL